MSHEHVHHTYEEQTGLGIGMMVGVLLALLIVILAAFLFFGGVFAGNGTTDTDGGTGGAGSEASPTSYQYMVPDYQLVVR
jgi:hypothetical protein